MRKFTVARTGFSDFDVIIDNLRVGDNVVLQVDDLDDYRVFVDAMVEATLEDGSDIVYIRFANHEPLIGKRKGVVVYDLTKEDSFETFSTHIHNIITDHGEYAFYVFDCLSDLISKWATDLMIGNFFLVTCPYLFQLNTIAYFGIIRNNHSYKTIARIRDTTQVLIDIYNDSQFRYVHPLKVWKRYSPSMYMPYVMKGKIFSPITNSADAASLFSCISRYDKCQPGMTPGGSKLKLDYWDRFFIRAEELLSDNAPADEIEKMKTDICKVMIGREKRILGLVKKYFALEDLLTIKTRLIGTGFIGGKSVGMLLSRKIVASDNSRDWNDCLEQHDSFFIGSDVFYTYIVQNGLWQLRMEQKKEENYFTAAKTLREKMQEGIFPDEILEQFQQLLEYFGQSPIIIRSSSLLEDGFGNAFAGKYESFFCVNQGSPDERLQAFLRAVRDVYSSAMNEDALTYRLQRGLAGQDEQMALLVQRVSGAYHRKYFFPEIAGVGMSYNAYIWKADMDAKAGMARLVFGLGTRAVNRVEDDYPRIVALDMPTVQPHSGIDDTRFFSQHKVDILDIAENKIDTVLLSQLLLEESGLDIGRVASKDHEMSQRKRERGIKEDVYLITFQELLSNTEFPKMIQSILKILESRYKYPVDIEFTVNFMHDGKMQINLLQCRPLQTSGNRDRIEIPETVPEEKTIIRSKGNFIGGSIVQSVRRVILVDAKGYGDLNQTEKYDVARLIGKLNRLNVSKDEFPVMLIGPGRWGTTTPSLGVPVSFSEINNMKVMVEVSSELHGITPELSFGTHFFQDLIETNIFYIALFPEKAECAFNPDSFTRMKDRLMELLPDSSKYAGVVKVFDFDGNNPTLMADLMSQRLVFGYFE